MALINTITGQEANPLKKSDGSSDGTLVGPQFFQTNLDILNSRAPQSNFAGTHAVPGAGDDNTAGWAVGSRILAIDGNMYVCRSAATGAATWANLTAPSGWQPWPVSGIYSTYDANPPSSFPKSQVAFDMTAVPQTAQCAMMRMQGFAANTTLTGAGQISGTANLHLSCVDVDGQDCTALLDGLDSSDTIIVSVPGGEVYNFNVVSLSSVSGAVSIATGAAVPDFNGIPVIYVGILKAGTAWTPTVGTIYYARARKWAGGWRAWTTPVPIVFTANTPVPYTFAQHLYHDEDVSEVDWFFEVQFSTSSTDFTTDGAVRLDAISLWPQGWASLDGPALPVTII